MHVNFFIVARPCMHVYLFVLFGWLAQRLGLTVRDLVFYEPMLQDFLVIAWISEPKQGSLKQVLLQQPKVSLVGFFTKLFLSSCSVKFIQ